MDPCPIGGLEHPQTPSCRELGGFTPATAYHAVTAFYLWRLLRKNIGCGSLKRNYNPLTLLFFLISVLFYFDTVFILNPGKMLIMYKINYKRKFYIRNVVFFRLKMYHVIVYCRLIKCGFIQLNRTFWGTGNRILDPTPPQFFLLHFLIGF